MKGLQFTQKKQGDVIHIDLQGNIDEDSVFPQLGVSSKLVIDFNDVRAINSCGIREWIKWITPLASVAAIVYQRCPKIIVDQMNMVDGFLPRGSKVNSFYVPYYCEDSDKEKLILFSRDKDFSDDRITPPHNVVDEQTGDAMEIDVIEAKYFKFLATG